jgi:hypothetical protein
MFKNKFLFLIVLGMLCYSNGYSQQSDLCNAISAIVNDAPNRFRNIRGKEIQSDMNAVIWDCGIKVPGTIASRFVVSMGSFYEGAFLQADNIADIKPGYEKYKALLSACLEPKGYKLSLAENFYPGMAAYKKLVFMKDPDLNSTVKVPPAHITLEATYNKEAKHYTIVLFIFEH